MTNEIKATFDVTTLEGRMKILNAKNAVVHHLKHVKMAQSLKLLVSHSISKKVTHMAT